MQLTGVRDAKSVAKVGDTISDLQEGIAAGCGWVIGVTSGAFGKNELLKGNPTHLVDQVTEIIYMLNIR